MLDNISNCFTSQPGLFGNNGQILQASECKATIEDRLHGIQHSLYSRSLAIFVYLFCCAHLASDFNMDGHQAFINDTVKNECTFCAATEL